METSAPAKSSSGAALVMKKLLFSPLFLLLLVLALSNLKSVFASSETILSVDSHALIDLITFITSLNLSFLFFMIFCTLADDIMYVVPILILGAVTPFLFVGQQQAIFVCIGIFLSGLITFWFHSQTMKNYLTFSAPKLIAPPAKQAILMVTIFMAIAFYIGVHQSIQKNGFQIPDSILDIAINLSKAQNGSMPSTDTSTTQIDNSPISAEQLQALKANPALLKQYGLDPKILDTLQKPSSVKDAAKFTFQDQIKNTIKTQAENFIKPYQSFIAPVLALLFFISMTSLSSFFGIFFTPIVWLIFRFLEWIGFIHFEKEMREVKKLVV